MNYNSPEYNIVLEKLKTIPLAELQLANIIEEYIYDTVVEENEKGKKIYRTKFGVKDREYKVWYENGRLHWHCYYKDGKLDGEFKVFYGEGTLCSHSYYKDDKLDGEYKMFYEEGTLCSHSYYKDDSLK